MPSLRSVESWRRRSRRTQAGTGTMNDELDVMSRLVDYHDHISAPSVPVADDVRRGRRRVRRNRGLLAGGAALGLASVVAAMSLFAGEGAVDRPQPADPPGPTTRTFVSPINGFAVGYRDLGDGTVSPATQLWGVSERADAGFDVVEAGSAAVFKGTSTKIRRGSPSMSVRRLRVAQWLRCATQSANRRSPSMGSWQDRRVSEPGRGDRGRRRASLSVRADPRTQRRQGVLRLLRRHHRPTPGDGGRHPALDDDLRLADLRLLLRVSRQRGARTGRGALGSPRRPARQHPAQQPIRCSTDRLERLLRGASTEIPDGVSIDEWYDEHVSRSGCGVPRSQQSEIVIDGQLGRFAVCPNQIEATVVAGGRLYLFMLGHERSDAAAFFAAWIATIELTPETAAGPRRGRASRRLRNPRPPRRRPAGESDP
jgi:hypothetical protein